MSATGNRLAQSGAGVPADRVHRIAIVGGGAAGWLAAAALARLLKPSFCDIRVIDSRRDGAGAFSEVALPSFHCLNHLLGINEEDLIRKTRGTFKLGAQFSNWGRLGERYFHTFGSLGAKLDAVPFHHYWIKLRQLGEGTSIDAYSTAAVAARHGRFAHPVLDRRSVLSLYSYGYHFHAASLAAYLREYAQAHGVTRIDREVVDVRLRGEDGFIDALKLDDGSSICADLYVDCTGPRGVLSQRALNTGYEDWSHWLPCDRLVGIPCASAGHLAAYSESSAERSGWRRRIPLQQCVDSGYVYSSRHVSDDEAAATLLADLPGDALAEPRLLRLSPGRPTRFWNKNCVSLASSIFDPLESTGLHLIQTGITRLITLFPVARFSPSDIEEYNRLTTQEYERIRDFLILHYKSTQHYDSPFWTYCRHMEIPDTLRDKIELFRCSGRVAMFDEEHFGEDSWLSLFIGQNIEPQNYDPLADVLDIGEVRAALSRMRSMIQEGVDTMPTHTQYVQAHCFAKPGVGP
jgi:tryptophan 7-halogenase